MKKNLVLLGMGALLAAAAPVKAANVTTELALLSDVSGSVDDADFALLRGGYVATFQDPAVINAITTFGPIAATLVYWSDGQHQVVPWTLISDAASANAFAAAVAAAPRPESGGTGLADAINYGSTLFANNGFESAHQIIDIAGDGSDSVAGSFNPNPANVKAARDNAINNAGVDTINALWVDDRDFFGDDPQDAINALDYGANNVIAGAGAFEEIVQDFPQFEEAVIRKITREVVTPTGGVPDAGATAVLLTGAVGMLGLLRRRVS